MGVFYAMKHQIPAMERQFRETGKGGAIVNIASVAGLAGARACRSMRPPSTAWSA